MILQGTGILTSFIHIISESLLAPVVIILVIFLIYAILSLGGFLNEWFTKKPLKSDGLESLLQDISKSNDPDELKGVVNSSGLYKEQKVILEKIVNNYNLGPDARKAFASKSTLAQSLTIAFDTTVTGLTIGAIGFVISKYRKQWYESDLTTTETVAEAILEKLGEF